MNDIAISIFTVLFIVLIALQAYYVYTLIRDMKNGKRLSFWDYLIINDLISGIFKGIGGIINIAIMN